MSEHYRALIVILVLASVVFAFAKAPATASAMTSVDFNRRRNCWYFITIAGFLSPNFWIYIVVVGLFLIFAVRREPNQLALYFFVLLALPPIRSEVPGFAGVRYLFDIDYLRLLSLTILLPTCIHLLIQPKNKNNKTYLPDILLSAYVILNVILVARYSNVTGVLRSLFYWIIEVVLPYYALSRSLKNLQLFREVLVCFVVAAMIASVIGVFEFLKRWILYSSLGGAWDIKAAGGYLLRGDYLRAVATSGQTIILGYILAIAIGFYLFLHNNMGRLFTWYAGLFVLVAGEISPLSRGPWVGLALIIIVFIATGPNRIKNTLKLASVSFPLILISLTTEFGVKILDYLPFVGSVDESNVTYRQQLFQTSINIILENPLFGSTDYLLDMEEMRQGQGLIDLVNTFLVVGLNSGITGLLLFSLFFISIMIGIIRRIRRFDESSDSATLGRSILAVLFGILVIIATVSPIYSVPLLYWSVAAMGLAYFINFNPTKANTLRDAKA